MTSHERAGQEIAIVGMAGRFPGAGDVAAFWENLCAGVESVSFFSDAELAATGIDAATLRNPSYVKANAVLDNVDLFDAAFFGYSPREAEILDPQHRIFLECAWETLEHAGYDPAGHDGAIGLYAGLNISAYLLFNLAGNVDLVNSFGLFSTLLANDKDYLPTRVSYKLNLTGPSVNVNTACSTSLVAVHLACQSLLNGECDLALAGGISLSLRQRSGYLYEEGGIASPDGHCRAFDAAAQGTVSGSGVGIVVLKALDDALADGDTIYAVIKGSAVNNDGALKVGYTAPSIAGQAKVIREALAVAEVAPETIGYVEAHGTATPLGDPIEISALTQVYRETTDRSGFCPIGSVKTNVGHLGAAAGVAGLIKAVLALKHGCIPPSLNFREPNPAIDFAHTPFYVNTKLAEWPAGPEPRRAGVSSFGIGGTNAHVILEEAPPVEVSESARPWHLLVLSARSSAALEAATTNLAAHLKRHPDLNLADVAYTLQVGRHAFGSRHALVCRDVADAVHALEQRTPDRLLTQPHEREARPVVFMFPGQGAQHPHMAAELYATEPIFRTQVDRCAELLRPHLGLDLRELIFDERRTTNDEGPTTIDDRRWTIDDRQDSSSIVHRPSSDLSNRLDQTQYAQSALFVVEYALARLWMSWGIRPQAMIGHSIGEYVAATLAGVFSLEDALKLVAARGQLMQQLPPGAMLSVPLSEQELTPLLGTELALAAVNAPRLCVVSGALAAVEALERRLAQQNIDCRRLRTSHAFHSAMLDPIVEVFMQQVAGVKLNPPRLPFVSNLTGTWIAPGEATDPRYWARQLRETVRFADGIRALLAEQDRILLEVGPGRTLCTLARQQLDASAGQLALPSLGHPRDRQPDAALVLGTLGKLWLLGAPVRWTSVYSGEQRRRVALPTYPFERQRYWVAPRANGAVAALVPAETNGTHPPGHAPDEQALSLHPRPALLSAYVAPTNSVQRKIAALWQELLGVEQVGIYDNFFELGGHSLLATQLITRLQAIFPLDLSLRNIFEAGTVAEQAEVVEELLLEKLTRGESAARPASIPRRPADARPPLSFAQQRLWVIDQLIPNSPAYNIFTTVRLTGRLRPAALERALNAVVRRHESLRTTFQVVDGQPVQVIAPELAIALPLIDLSAEPASAREQTALRLASAEVRRPFDLGRGPLLRATLFRLGDDAHMLVLIVHHIVSDGWSIGILVRELAAFYDEFANGRPAMLPALPIQYPDFALWQRNWLQGEVLERQLGFWRRSLEGAPLVLELPTDHPRPAVQSFRGAAGSFVVQPDVVQGLRALCRREEVTLFMALLAAYQTLMYRYSGQRDILVGTPIANRTRMETEGLIGFFANTLVVRTHLSDPLSFRELAGRVRESTLEAHAHQDLPFEKLVDVLQPTRDMSRNPLFQVMFVLQNTPATRLETPGLTLEVVPVKSETSKFDLWLSMEEHGEIIVGAVECNTDLFDGSTMLRIMRHFQALLRGIAADSTQRLADLPLLAEAERQQLLIEWNDTAAGVRGQGSGISSAITETCIHRLFEAQVERTPDAIALFFDPDWANDERRRTKDEGSDSSFIVHRSSFIVQLSYAELNRRANRLAHHLQCLGVGPDARVGMCVERSIDLVIGLFGILKAGGAYVPIDPVSPPERLAFMIRDARVHVLLTQSHVLAGLPANGARAICLDSDRALWSAAPATNPASAVTIDNLGYVIYTSGSTGTPKGVAMSHRALVNLLAWQLGYLGQQVGTRFLQFASLSFDVSYQEIFPTLASGGVVALISEELRRDVRNLWLFLARADIDRVYLPYVGLRQLAEAADLRAAVPRNLRQVTVSGEQLQITGPIIRMFQALGGSTLNNFYGPSESHAVTAYSLRGDPQAWPALAPIGRPIANSQMYVVDQRMRPAPIGVHGELLIGGACLAYGYLNRPDLTAERFIPNPFAEVSGIGYRVSEDSAPNTRYPIPNTRLYKTGDLARYLADGSLEFLGRIDQQVKVRGYRVELEEIETVLARHPDVRECVVLAREDVPGDKRLVAYVVPANDQRSTTNDEDADSSFVVRHSSFVSEVRTFLKQHLPEYMVPSVFVPLDALPLTINRKIDRKALPAPDTARPDLGREFVAPRTPLEAALAEIWSRIIGVERVGVYDNFFELGGDSIRSIQIVIQANKAGLRLSPKLMFQHQTIAELAAVAELSAPVQAEPGAEAGLAPFAGLAQAQIDELAAARGPIADTYPLGPFQAYMLDQRLHHDRPGLYLASGVYEIPFAIEPAIFARAWQRVIDRHPALRSSFVWEGLDQPLQVVHQRARLDVAHEDLRELTPQEQQARVAEYFAAVRRQGFGLAAAPHTDVALFRVGDESYRFVWTFDYMLQDGWGFLVVQDFLDCYQALSGGHEPPPNPARPYRDYIAWARRQDHATAEAFWRTMLKGFREPTPLVACAPGNAPADAGYSAQNLLLPAALTAEIQELARRHQLTPYTVLQAAWALLLSRYTGMRDVVYGVVVSGRPPELEGVDQMVGLFNNLLPMRLRIDPAEPLLAWLRRIQDQLADLRQYEYSSPLQVARWSDVPADLPLFESYMVYENLPISQSVREYAGDKRISVSASLSQTDHPLRFVIFPGPQIMLNMSFYPGCFDPATIARMLADFQAMLESIVEHPEEQLGILLSAAQVF